MKKRQRLAQKNEKALVQQVRPQQRTLLGRIGSQRTLSKGKYHCIANLLFILF